jgi:hypothetical protein
MGRTQNYKLISKRTHDRENKRHEHDEYVHLLQMWPCARVWELE